MPVRSCPPQTALLEQPPSTTPPTNYEEQPLLVDQEHSTDQPLSHESSRCATGTTATALPSLQSEAWSTLLFALPLSYICNVIGLFAIIAISAAGSLGKDALVVFASARTISTFAMYGPTLGISMTLETLCSQSFTGSAGTNPHLTGYWLQRAIVIVTALFVIAEAALWNSEWLLQLVFPSNSATINKQAVVFLRWDLLYFYIGCLSDCTKRWLVAQDVKAASALGVSTGAIACLVSCHFLVANPAIGVYGAPISLACTYLTHLLTMIAYVRVTGCGQDTWSGWNWTEAVRDWRLFATLGVPAAITMTIEYSSQEIIAIAAARFGPLALAVHPIVASAYRMCVNSFPLPVGIANANRVGHALGEANARRARRVAVAGSMLGCAISAAAALVLLCFRREVAEHYSLQLDVVAMAASLFPYAAAAALFIGINSALDGILRGQGRQLQGFLFKVVSFYVLALPIGHTLAFRWMWGVAGLWIAIATGGLATAVLQVWWIAGTDWSYEVLLCRQQIGKSTVELDGTSDEDEPGSVV